MTARPARISPPILALQQAIEAGARLDLAAYGRAIAAQGTQRIDLQADDPAHASVTFRWRGDAATQIALVNSGPGRAGHHEGG